MLKSISAVILALSTLVSVGCATTEPKQPSDASDALFMLEDCFYSTKSSDERLLDSVRYFHQQTAQDKELNFDFVKNELHYCRTGEDLF